MRCRWCVGFACEVDAKNGTHNTVIPDGAGHRQLRAAHRVHGAGDPARRPRAAPPAWPTSMRDDRLQEQPARPGGRLARGAIESARLLLNSKSRLLPERPRQPLRLGGPQPAWPHLHRRDRPVRFRDLRRPRPGRHHRHLRFQPRQPRPGGRRMLANEFIRLPYQFIGMTPPRVPRWGAGAQGLHAPVLQAAHRRAWGRCRRCRCSTRACRWTRR